MDELTECAYCRKEVYHSQMKPGKIIFLNSKTEYGRRKKFVDEKVNWYCSDMCHERDQMSHEG